MDQQFLFIFMIVLLSCASNECSLISQSSIKTCQVGDSNEPTTNSSAGRICKEKIVVSMTLMSDQKNSDSLYANVREVYQAGESKASLLKKPFRIEISKSETISSYRVYYRGSANAKPSEHSSLYEWRDDCRDGWNDPHLSRPRQPNTDGGVEWDSQGFCCRCGSKRENTYLKRPGAFCRNRDIATLFWHGYIELENDQLQKYGSSIHYMKLNDKWYDVFDIDQPILQYKVMVSLLEYNGILGVTESGVSVGNWTLLSSFELSPSNTVSRSPNGRVVARIEGELLGSSDPYDFITKKLLVPSSRVFSSDNTQPQKTTGTNEWMLVEESMVDLSGKECNKIGTSYTAFRSQPVACQRDFGTCFSNQPLDLLKHDGERFKSGKMGKYLLHNYGQVHPSTHPDDNSFILRFVHTSLHNTFVTFYIDASDIQFVVNSVRGRIVEVTASDFTVNEENGRIVVYVENVGEIAGDFLISLTHCHDDRVPSSKKTSIAPGQIKSVSFNFQAFVDKAQEVQCVVELYDVNYNLLGTSNVDLKVNVSCFCYGECGCVCNENGTVTIFECPLEPPVVIETGSIFLRLFLVVLRIVGIHGIVGFFAGILLILGFIKLLFGGVCCCRKSKAQAYYDKQKKKGVRVQQATLFKCTGECRGALMAKARQKRKVERIRKLGKDPYRLDDWRNTSFVCNCNDELTDIRCSNIIKSIFFFYYCFFLPFIWLGRKIWWSVFRDTMKNKEAAKKTVLRSAKKDGKLETLGIVDIGAELQNVMISDKKKEELTLSAQKAAVLENNTDKERVKTELSKDPKLAATSDPVPEYLEDAAEPSSDKTKKGSKKDGQKSEMDTSQKSTEQVESFHSALLCVNATDKTSQKPTSIEQIDSFHSALLCVNTPSEDHPKLAATSEPVPANLGDATKLPGEKAKKKKKGSKKDRQKSKKEKKGKTKELDTHIKKDRNIDRTAQKERKLTSRMHSPKPGKRVTGKSKHSDWMNEEVHDWDRADRKLEKISRRDERDDRRAPREPRSTSRSRRSDKQRSERRERRGRSSRSRGTRERRERSSRSRGTRERRERSSRSRGTRERRERSSRSRGTRERRERSSRSRGAREKRPREKTRFSGEKAARDDKKDHNSDSDESKEEQKLTGKKSLSSIESKHEALAEKVSSHHSKELNNIYDEIASQHSSQHLLASNSKKDASVHSDHSSHHGAPSVHSDHSSHHGSQQPSVHSDHSSHHGSQQPSVHSDHSSHHDGSQQPSEHSSHHGSPSVHSDHSSHHGSQQPSVQESTRSSLYSTTSHSKSSVEDSKDDLHSSQASKQSSESNSTSTASSSNRNTSHSTDHTGVATSSSTSQTDSSNLLSHTSASDIKENTSHSTGPTSTMKSSSTSSRSNSSSLPHSQDRTTSQESSVSSSEEDHDNTTEHTHSESSEESSDHSDSKDTTEHKSSEESSDHSDSEPSEESDSEDSNEDDETDTSDEESEPESSSEHSDSEHSQTDSSESSSSEHSSHATSHTPTSHSSHTPTSHSSHTHTMSSYTSSTLSSIESRRP